MKKTEFSPSPETPNYNSINTDYTGERNLEDNQELVQYLGQSAHRIWLNDLAEDYSSHWHPAMEIIMPVENYYDIVDSSATYRVNEGEIAIIPPQLLHELKAPSQGKRFIFIMDISGISTLKGFAGISAILSQPLVLSRDEYPIIFDDIYDILIKIRNEYYKNSDYSELAIQSLLLNFFIKLGENHDNSAELFHNVRPNKHRDYVQRFNQLLEYINDHYMEDLYLDNIADMAGFSKYHFSRLFKQYTNFTFCEYLVYRRVKAATSLLSDPDYSITDVAMDSGFQSISTFNRLFKQQMGCTPREYRTRNHTSSILHSDN